MNDKNTFSVSYGIMAGTITKQLNEQGFPGDFKKFDDMRDAVNNLWFSEVMTDGEHDKCIARIQAKIKKELSSRR